MIRRALRNKINRFWGQEETKYLVRTYFKSSIYGVTQKLGKAIGVTLYKPEGVKKYPYIEYEFLECIKWGKYWCLESMSYQTAGTPMYWCFRDRIGREYISSGFVALVENGAITEYTFWGNEPPKNTGVMENAKKIIDTKDVMKSKLKLELSAYAVSKGWSIARRCPEENYLAIWCEKNGILKVLETPPSTNALSIDERIMLEEEE